MHLTTGQVAVIIRRHLVIPYEDSEVIADEIVADVKRVEAAHLDLVKLAAEVDKLEADYVAKRRDIEHRRGLMQSKCSHEWSNDSKSRTCTLCQFQEWRANSIE